MPLLHAFPLFAVAFIAQSPAAPAPEAGSAAAATPPAAPAITTLPGLSWSLIAKEPLVQDPVSFCIADDGSIYVAESFRQEKGVEDNRSSKFWLEDDLQLQTVQDRLKMYEKWAAKRQGGMDYYRKEEDRVTHLVDTNGDGVPDKMSSFSGPINEPLDGTGAGVMYLDGSVWYTCIPNLWRFQDTTGTGVADVREKVFTGFGVRTALRGHDMHGLVAGPDGRIYWSIGDRGYNVTNKEGKNLKRVFTGAVFRCEPDGSRLEIFAHSLRNPQELAFNQWGDLFTGDNNSDGGDRARIVYIMEGGETGWDMNYQTLEGSNQRGPWNQERSWWKWDTADTMRPAWNLPPIEHLADGPAGMTFYPGLGLPDRYKNHFFLCDFLGGDEYSQILSFAVEP
jgi:quinoprotein glucose dehydrogenase